MIDAHNPIQINKPAGYRIIVAAVQVVQPTLGIVVISPVADGVLVCHMVLVGDRIAVCVGHADDVAPGVLGIFGNNITLHIYQRHHVALHILQEIIVGPVIAHAGRRARRVIVEPDVAAVVFLLDQPAVIVIIEVDRIAARRLFHPLAVYVIAIVYYTRPFL